MVRAFLNRSQTSSKRLFGPSSEELLAEENQEVREERQRLKEEEKKTERKGTADLTQPKNNRECATPQESN